MNKSTIKYAGFNGNLHWSERTTKFFDTAEQARQSDPNCDIVQGVANWQEHIEWSKQRVGMYEYRQIEK